MKTGQQQTANDFYSGWKDAKRNHVIYVYCLAVHSLYPHTHTHTMWMQQLDALIENSDYISFVQRKSSFVKLIVVQKQNHFLKRKKGVRKRGRERERRKKHLTLVFNLGWMWTDNEYLQCTAIVSEYFPFFIFRYRHNGRKFRGNNYFSFFSAIVSNEMHDTRANGKPIEAST